MAVAGKLSANRCSQSLHICNDLLNLSIPFTAAQTRLLVGGIDLANPPKPPQSASNERLRAHTHLDLFHPLRTGDSGRAVCNRGHTSLAVLLCVRSLLTLPRWRCAGATSSGTNTPCSGAGVAVWSGLCFRCAKRTPNALSLG